MVPCPLVVPGGDEDRAGRAILQRAEVPKCQCPEVPGSGPRSPRIPASWEHLGGWTEPPRLLQAPCGGGLPAFWSRQVRWPQGLGWAATRANADPAAPAYGGASG